MINNSEHSLRIRLRDTDEWREVRGFVIDNTEEKNKLNELLSIIVDEHSSLSFSYISLIGRIVVSHSINGKIIGEASFSDLESINALIEKVKELV